jgi:hypothetical protein
MRKDINVHRPVQANGKIVSKPILGGLHHVFSRVAYVENLKQNFELIAKQGR